MPVPRIALVGAPNTGKSTLFNRLLGRRRALVHPEPGMTRDVNEARFQIRGRETWLVDTGGLVGAEDASLLGGAVRDRVLEVVREASVVIFLVDGKSGLGPQDEDLATLFHRADRPVILAVNKMESPARSAAAAEFWRLGFERTLEISAEHGHGVDDLLDAVEGLLPAEDQEATEEAGAEVRIAVAGRPNVGKSSLLNALAGRARSIVSDEPGTTRDAVETSFTRGQAIWRVVDTAGLRRRGHVARGPESLSVMAARRSIASVDVVILVMDCTEAPTAQDLHVAGIAHDAGRPFVVAINKWDREDKALEAEALIARVKARLRFAPYAPVVTVSALTGLRVDRLLPIVAEVHAQAMTRLATARLNRWLRDAVASHPPSGGAAGELKLHYAAQTSTNPPSILIFTNRTQRPHFSYTRYLENSLRTAFRLDRTPVILKFRKKPPGRRNPSPADRRTRRRRV